MLAPFLVHSVAFCYSDLINRLLLQLNKNLPLNHNADQDVSLILHD